MNEVKRPKKPLMYYYMVVMTIVVLFNLLAMPWIADKQVKEVDYGTFMTMTEDGNIGREIYPAISNSISKKEPPMLRSHNE